MSKPIPGRASYDAAPKGYKRHTIFIQTKLLDKVRKQAVNEGITIKQLIEEAIKQRVANDD
jgi:hypothetical protein